MSGSTTVGRFIRAPRAAVYGAFLDPALVARFLCPDGMTVKVHRFEAREGGTFRISLAYDSTDHEYAGKTAEHEDAYGGRFVLLSPNEKIVQALEFETTDPSMQGENVLTLLFEDERDGTRLTATHDGLPEGIRPEDNVTGWEMSLEKLARLLE